MEFIYFIEATELVGINWQNNTDLNTRKNQNNDTNDRYNHDNNGNNN